MKKILASIIVVIWCLNAPAFACGGGAGGTSFTGELEKSAEMIVEQSENVFSQSARQGTAVPSGLAKGAASVVGSVLGLLFSAADAVEVMGSRGVNGFHNFFRESFSTKPAGTTLPDGVDPNTTDVVTKGIWSAKKEQATYDHWMK